MLVEPDVSETIDQVDELPKVVEQGLVRALIFLIHQLIFTQ